MEEGGEEEDTFENFYRTWKLTTDFNLLCSMLSVTFLIQTRYILQNNLFEIAQYHFHILFAFA